jgi:hypothetical protein
MIFNKDLKNNGHRHPFDGGNVVKGLQLVFIATVFAIVLLGCLTA